MNSRYYLVWIFSGIWGYESVCMGMQKGISIKLENYKCGKLEKWELWKVENRDKCHPLPLSVCLSNCSTCPLWNFSKFPLFQSDTLPLFQYFNSRIFWFTTFPLVLLSIPIYTLIYPHIPKQSNIHHSYTLRTVLVFCTLLLGGPVRW